uniref:X-linked Kx blood group related 5 n=1 Tax=Mus musculus TaxID=10090 RepID=D6RJ59_MOUSE
MHDFLHPVRHPSMHGSSPYSKPGALSPFSLLSLVLCKELREEATLERQHLASAP